ncbi:MAG: CsgG/HfaB family protein [Acidobacteria bacterium]|nr:CsgG/HfaB family protein [Acidobacteriota bacterium]MBV9475305.1 CsgG/HfaB family protein [Acidobacteriota bacterium]
MRKSLVVSVFALLLVTASAFAGEKPAIGVAEFKNETSASWWYSDAASDLAGMLTNELASTGKFKIVERAKLGPVLDEQDLAESGRIKKSTGAKIGKLTGAKYLVFATVSAFDTKSRGTGGALSFRGISVGGKKEDAYIAVDLRVVDTTTGEVEYTRTVEGRAASYGMSGGVYRGGFGGELGKYENTPTGKAIRAVIVEISDYLACAMVEQGSCMDEYNAKESSRREKTKKAIKLD